MSEVILDKDAWEGKLPYSPSLRSILLNQQKVYPYRTLDNQETRFTTYTDENEQVRTILFDILKISNTLPYEKNPVDNKFFEILITYYFQLNNAKIANYQWFASGILWEYNGISTDNKEVKKNLIVVLDYIQTELKKKKYSEQKQIILKRMATKKITRTPPESLEK